MMKCNKKNDRHTYSSVTRSLFLHPIYIVISLFVVSCGSSNKVVSSSFIQARKYNKGIHFSVKVSSDGIKRNKEEYFHFLKEKTIENSDMVLFENKPDEINKNNIDPTIKNFSFKGTSLGNNITTIKIKTPTESINITPVINLDHSGNQSHSIPISTSEKPSVKENFNKKQLPIPPWRIGLGMILGGIFLFFVAWGVGSIILSQALVVVSILLVISGIVVLASGGS